MCLGTTHYSNCGCGCAPVSFHQPGPTICVPCLPSRDEEISKLEHCLETLKEKARGVEERITLLKEEK